MSGTIDDRIGKELSREFEVRKALTDEGPYKFSLGYVQISEVSDPYKLISTFREHVKKYNGHVPEDVVIVSGNTVYALMYGDAFKAAETLMSFFGDPFTRTKPAAPSDVRFEGKVGFSFYGPAGKPHGDGKQLLQMIKEANAGSIYVSLLPEHLPEDRVIRAKSPAKVSAYSKLG